MMQEREFVFGWDSKSSSKRSSGLFSVLKWFGNKETITPSPPDLVHSASSSCDSIESVFSTESVASFAFVPPNAYRPFGSASQPEKFILPGPETSTYRARLAQREVRRETDRNLTLRSKYNLYKGPDTDRGHSLPLMRQSPPVVQKGMQRRTASESSKHRRAGAYCHVKGKRKAPQPPGSKGDNTLRRKKRMAPQPPGNSDIICNDSLKLDKGILKSAKVQVERKLVTQEVHQVSPRPWYKRTLSKSSTPEKKPDAEKRKSGLSFLTNISELDREAMEIIGKENLKMKYLKNASHAPAFMRPRGEHSRTNSDSWLSPKRKSAKDLIAKFNAITGVTRMSLHSGSKESVKEQTPPAKETKNEFVIPIVQEASPSTSQTAIEVKEVQPKSPVARTTAVVKPISRSQWNCPKSEGKVAENLKTENKNDLFGLSNTELRISELQRSVFQSHYPKLSLNSEFKPEIITNETKDKELPKIVNEIPKVSETRSIFQSQYPRVSLNVDLKTANTSDKVKDTPPTSASSSTSETKNVFQSQYPRVNLNLSKELELLTNPQKNKNEDSSKSTENKSRVSIFDFGFEKSELPKEEVKPLKKNDVVIEIKKEQIDSNKDDKKKMEKMILGDELSFKEPKNSTRDEKKMESKILEEKPAGEKIRIEKMILGDELSVEKPEYENVNKYEKIEVPKNENKSQKIEEKMILGDEISVKKTGDSSGFQAKMELLNLLKTNDSSKNGAISKTIKVKQQIDDEKRDSAKREEREKLKKMLIEMKNSLPKRSGKLSKEQKQRVSLIQEQSEPEIEEPQTPNEEKTAEIIIATTETVYENVKVRNDNVGKPVKVSSAAQTNAIFRRNLTDNETATIKQSNTGFQLIGAKDFVGISNEKTGNSEGASHTYANLCTADATMPDIFAGCSKTDTLEINRLLRRLETAIAGGELGQASVLARDLAQLKVPLSVIRQKSDAADKNKGNTKLFNVDMYVEDKISHRGPFPLQVTETMTVAELKNLVEEKYKIPRGVQRWILGKQLAANDNAILADHQISSSGCPVFLYLVAPANETRTETNTIEIVEIVNDIEPPQTPITLDKVPIANINGGFDTDNDVEESDNDVEIIDDQAQEEIEDLWKCRACTLLNPDASEQCEVCGLIRNEAEDKGNDNQTYLQLVNLDNEDLIKNAERFECLVCFAECQPNEGVTLRECLHQFCRTCLAHTVEFSEEAEVKCPYRDDQYACDMALQDREVKALVSAAVYEQHLAKSVKQAENKMDNTFHCKTPDCKGWCIYEDNVNDFHCPVCRHSNCLTCQAIHSGRNCKQYQEQMKDQSETDEDARRTRDFLEDMIKRGEALACPTCQVVLLKKWGCDWLRCSMCKTEICWVTRGPRWGPAGKGDTSGGCKCGVNGTKCHPKCNYCH
ncbi:ariadne 1 [Carabus blaptoides fortunei]